MLNLEFLSSFDERSKHCVELALATHCVVKVFATERFEYVDIGIYLHCIYET